MPDGAFWAECCENHTGTDVVDAAFVDDECLVLLASSPRALDLAIKVLLRTLVGTFRNLHLAINWKPGKTEALLCYHGKRAVSAREQWRTASGKLEIPVPSMTDCDYRSWMSTSTLVLIVPCARKHHAMLSIECSLRCRLTCQSRRKCLATTYFLPLTG